MKLNTNIFFFLILTIYLWSSNDCSAGKEYRDESIQAEPQYRAQKKAKIAEDIEPMDEGEDELDVYSLTNNQLILFCYYGNEAALREADRRILQSLSLYPRSLYVRYKYGHHESLQILLKIIADSHLN